METIRYLENDQNHGANLDEYVKSFQKAIEGQVETPQLKNGVDFNPLILILKEKIREIESRLIHNDRDQTKKRERLRGRIEGLKSALYEINAFDRSNFKE